LPVLQKAKSSADWPPPAGPLLRAVQQHTSLCADEAVSAALLDCLLCYAALPTTDAVAARGASFAAARVGRLLQLRFAPDAVETLVGDLRLSRTALLSAALQEGLHQPHPQPPSLDAAVDMLFTRAVLAAKADMRTAAGPSTELGELCAQRPAAWLRVVALCRAACLESHSARRAATAVCDAALLSVAAHGCPDPLAALFPDPALRPVVRSLAAMTALDPRDVCDARRRECRCAELVQLHQQRLALHSGGNDADVWLCAAAFFGAWTEFAVFALPLSGGDVAQRRALCAFVAWASVPPTLAARRSRACAAIEQVVCNGVDDTVLPVALRARLAIACCLAGGNEAARSLLRALDSTVVASELFAAARLFASPYCSCCTEHQKAMGALLQ